MGIMQLLNIILFWFFFGFLASYIAKRKNRHPLGWFAIGLFLGVFGVLLALFFPKRSIEAPQENKPRTPVFSERSEFWVKMWYYLDPAHAQAGPIEFPDLIKLWKEKGISQHSYVWGEGMAEWKKLSDLPDVLSEMDKVT